MMMQRRVVDTAGPLNMILQRFTDSTSVGAETTMRATPHNSRRNAVRCAWIFALVVAGFAVSPLLSWGEGPIHIPGPNEGYALTPPNDSHQDAPTGYEGRTDTSSRTAVGNTPATAGQTITYHFTLENKVKTCPLADGTAEGAGKFSMSLDYTDAQSDATTIMHLEVSANAKYKGEVGENAFLEGPVKANIDYSYNFSGSRRDTGGAITTLAPTHIEQHITIPFFVSKDMGAPDILTFNGGDPTQGRYADAVLLGQALTY